MEMNISSVSNRFCRLKCQRSLEILVGDPCRDKIIGFSFSPDLSIALLQKKKPARLPAPVERSVNSRFYRRFRPLEHVTRKSNDGDARELRSLSATTRCDNRKCRTR